MDKTKIVLFRGREVRKTIHDNEWWFVVEDVVRVLTDSNDPKQYIQRMKSREPQLQEGWVQIVHTLLIQTPGGPQSARQEEERRGKVTANSRRGEPRAA